MFENEADRKRDTGYYPPAVEMKDYKVMTDSRNVFNQPIRNGVQTSENITKIAIGQGDDYMTDCLLSYLDFKNNCKVIALVLIKQQALHADQKAIQKINSRGNLDQAKI